MRWIAKTSLLQIRPYQPADRASLMKIAADTAFFGAPIETYLNDRRIFQDYFYAYYTDYEPEHAWVAVADGNVVGFLTGCIDTRRQIQVTKKKLLPRVLLRLVTGKYKLGAKTRLYYRKLRIAQRPENMAYVNLDHYPAHLHINVDAEWRGHGIGQRLMQMYLDQLIYLGIPGVHLGTTSENEAACRLYSQLGFKLLDSKPTDQWTTMIDHPVETRLYGLLLPRVEIE